MKIPRRRFLELAAGAAALPAVSRIAYAEAYPLRPAQIIVCAAAGGTNDIVARLIGQWLSDKLGQPYIVEDRPGAGGRSFVFGRSPNPLSRKGRANPSTSALVTRR
jgi:tripartite-type tricarboxylate transporter receptor subunit TctC